MAAAIDRMICHWASRPGGRYADAAYRVAENAVRDAGAGLQGELKLSKTRLW